MSPNTSSYTCPLLLPLLENITGNSATSSRRPNLCFVPVAVAVIAAAAIGNGLVILSVFRTRALRRQITNHFVVSLAVADLAVAVLVMPLNLAQLLSQGRLWHLGRLLCNIFNSNDVFLSTASLVHIGCIAVDRYVAIIRPLHYPRLLTRRRAHLMLAGCWSTSLLISHLPIHSGIYTTHEQLALQRRCPLLCTFKVNMVYAVISSTVSFWIPSVTITIVYFRIYQEARLQQLKFLHSLPRPLQQQQQPHDNTTVAPEDAVCRKNFKSEHKAAKTLGIVMGCFIVCWLPFFVWYTVTNICGHRCRSYPDLLIDVLFWIGYTNSTLNPVIYAYYNRDFRKAFKAILSCNGRCWPWHNLTSSATMDGFVSSSSTARRSKALVFKYSCS